MPVDPARRFASRVESYIRYRPSYPESVIPFLAAECGIDAYSQIADIGSGTGILSKLFLDLGCEVTGVEPNAEMRDAGDRLLAGYERFRSVDARAERTGLPAHSFDLVAAGQAFHWFDPHQSRVEFRRILRPPHWVTLIWNERLTSGDPFLAGYEQLLRRCSTDYSQVDHRRIDREAINAFFEHTNWQIAVFDNEQEFDLEGVLGRLDSSSYVPARGTPEHAELTAAVARLFSRTARAGKIAFRYSTNVYVGTIA